MLGASAMFLIGATWKAGGRAAAETVALVITFAAIAWTAYETAALRAETVRQTDIEQRPFVVLVEEPDGFTVRNLGRGLALEVQVPVSEFSRSGRVPIRFLSKRAVPVLSPGQRAELELLSFWCTDVDGECASAQCWEQISFDTAARAHPDNVVVALRCTDVLGRWHEVRHALENGRFRPIANPH
jgi:hypothetical protein